ncbi:hypothetical protein SLEP1_g18460 [Rubroshorea leprosula]|uniref:Vacuolar protein sorting-associated protein Ist1 n=1 Tax=Rubroshorea leprosula TaxID=152421 RepID=A0AAV5J6M4_9ROSI|nr:hypothetical protein SLEP1_g18460 [Rubroshorea leprosula]
MLDGLLGRGYAGKCKSLIKLTKSRIDVIRRKRNATQKFLKKDIADLLYNGLDINAYGRAEGFLVELNLSWCYDFIETCSDFVLKHLTVLQKLRDCPEDCREAVSSIMFAAARFSDLPELRDLRNMFHERYGNSLELFVNQEFVENLASKPSTLEKRVMLMEQIALEFSIKWDSKDFEQRISKPAAVAKGHPRTYGSFHVNDDKSKSSNGKDVYSQGNKTNVKSQEKLEVSNDGHRLGNKKEDNYSNRNELNHQSRQESFEGYRPINGREGKDNHDASLWGRKEASASKREIWDGMEGVTSTKGRVRSSSHGRSMDRNDGGGKLPEVRENNVPRIDDRDILLKGKPDLSPSHAGQKLKNHDKDSFMGDGHDIDDTTRRAREDTSRLKPHYNGMLPPPYVKPNTKLKDSKHGAGLSFGSSSSDLDNDTVLKDASAHKKAFTVNRSDKNQEGLNHPDDQRPKFAPATVNGYHGSEKGYYYQNDGIDNPIPKPRSNRRRHHVKSSSQDDFDNDEHTRAVRGKSRSRRRDDSRRGLQVLFDDDQHKDDEEERIIDKLLMHYSKKPSSYEEGKVRRKPSRSHRAHHWGTEAGEAPSNITRDGSDEMSGIPPIRSTSLPPEPTTQPQAKVFARAATFQPDRSNADRHVHPKLPDYDDLAAQFAALRGR